MPTFLVSISETTTAGFIELPLCCLQSHVLHLCFTAQPSNYKLNTFVYIRYRGLPASGRIINIHEMHLTVCNIYIWTQVYNYC